MTRGEPEAWETSIRVESAPHDIDPAVAYESAVRHDRLASDSPDGQTIFRAVGAFAASERRVRWIALIVVAALIGGLLLAQELRRNDADLGLRVTVFTLLVGALLVPRWLMRPGRHYVSKPYRADERRS